MAVSRLDYRLQATFHLPSEYNNDQGHGTVSSFKLLDDDVPHISIRPYNACGDYNDDNDNGDDDEHDGTLIFSTILTFNESGWSI